MLTSHWSGIWCCSSIRPCAACTLVHGTRSKFQANRFPHTRGNTPCLSVPTHPQLHLRLQPHPTFSSTCLPNCIYTLSQKDKPLTCTTLSASTISQCSTSGSSPPRGVTPAAAAAAAMCACNRSWHSPRAPRSCRQKPPRVLTCNTKEHKQCQACQGESHMIEEAMPATQQRARFHSVLTLHVRLSLMSAPYQPSTAKWPKLPKKNKKFRTCAEPRQ